MSGAAVMVRGRVPRPPRPSVALLLSLAAVALPAGGLAGCGGGDDDAGTSAPAPAAPAPARTTPAPAPAGTAAAPGTTATAPAATIPQDTRTTGGASPESAPGGAGDEQPIRVPAEFSLTGDQVTPGKVTVPAFLPVELRFRAADGRAHDVLVRTPTPTRLSVPASGTATQVIDGLRAGLYLIVVDGRATNGALVAGGDAGP
jgi:hypothetical protein